MLGLFFGLLLSPGQVPTAPGLIAIPSQDGEGGPKLNFLEVETLGRGPVHEAYAAAGAAQNFSGNHWVTEPPPAALLEIPPGLGTTPTQIWIPGYWERDPEENNWIWVSGCWREPPIGFGWLPGYWTQVRANQWRRVGGVWSRGDGDTFSLEYTPAPPQQGSMNGGTPPRLDPRDGRSKGLIFSPAGWDWSGNRYSWRPGRLERFAESQVWQEQRQTWTPAGYIPSDGYIDHRLGARGIAYAPLRPVASGAAPRRNPVADPATEAIQPAGVWNANAWIECSWRDRTGNYYLGDYYSNFWKNSGMVPARDARRRNGDPWLQCIEDQSALDDAAFRQLAWQHTERLRGRQQPPARQIKPDQKVPAGAPQPTVLPAGRLDLNDPARDRMIRMVLDGLDHQNRLIRARMELERDKLEGKRLILKTPQAEKRKEEPEELTPFQTVKPKK